MSEAVRVVGDMLALFPNGGQNAEDGYIGGLAKVLCEYPRSVAIRASSPINGVARETDFLPTNAKLIAWCERETAPIAEDYAAAKRIESRVDDKTDPAVTARMSEVARAWLKREDPKAKKLTGQESVNGLKVAEERAESNRKAMERTRAETAQEWTAAGLQPLSIGKIPISMELARMMGVEPSTRQRDEDAA